VTSARLDRARARLAVDPTDPEAWEAVATEARTRPLHEARPLYEQARRARAPRAARAHAFAARAAAPRGPQRARAARSARPPP
jgi:hypothetical protein